MKLYVVPDPNESRTERLKRNIRETTHNALEWIKNNKETVILLAPVAVSVLKLGCTATKALTRRLNLRKAEKVKNMYCYDPSLGHYWALNRELTRKEWVSVDKRRKNGERLSEILDELRVLK